MHDSNDHGEGAAGHHGTSAPQRRGFKDKFLIPLAIPLGCGVVIAAIVLSMSQILLVVSASAATSIALFVALVVLLGCAYFATARTVTRQAIYAGIAVPAIALLTAGAFAGIYHRNHPVTEGAAGEQQAQAGAGAQPADEIATDDKFSVTAYTIEANKPTIIPLKNQGKADPHNMHILNVQDTNGSDIKTDLLQPGQSAQLSFTIGTAGTYNFQCDVHPTVMKGTITVVASNTSATAATAAAGPGAGGGLSEVTTDNKFSQTSLSVDKGVSAGLTVQNKGAAVHNWHVLNVKSSDGKDIKTDLVQGGQSATVTFEIDTPGTYDFQCDVHPTEMKGKLTVK